jgi:hypothetical protein
MLALLEQKNLAISCSFYSIQLAIFSSAENNTSTSATANDWLKMATDGMASPLPHHRCRMARKFKLQNSDNKLRGILDAVFTKFTLGKHEHFVL